MSRQIFRSDGTATLVLSVRCVSKIMKGVRINGKGRD